MTSSLALLAENEMPIRPMNNNADRQRMQGTFLSSTDETRRPVWHSSISYGQSAYIPWNGPRPFCLRARRHLISGTSSMRLFHEHTPSSFC